MVSGRNARFAQGYVRLVSIHSARPANVNDTGQGVIVPASVGSEDSSSRYEYEGYNESSLPTPPGPSVSAESGAGQVENVLECDVPMAIDMMDSQTYYHLPALPEQSDHVNSHNDGMFDLLMESIPEMWQTGLAPQMTGFPAPAAAARDLSGGPAAATASPRPEDYAYNAVLPWTGDGLILRRVRDELSGNTELYSLDIPEAVIDELIELYFQRVHVFLPLFHQPTFHGKHTGANAEQKYAGLKREYVLILLGMMALSARFSSSSYFDNTNIKDRCTPFAQGAQSIYHEAIVQSKPQPSSLSWLQGCILLAYYIQSCRPVWGSDLLIATCTRLAYNLKLHKIDEDELNTTNAPSPTASIEAFISKEEKRRAWWSVWELDAFDSITNRHPYAIDKSCMQVYLPVADMNWFQGIPTKSSILDPDISRCWKSLKDSPNKDERAWFLISNFILAQALETSQKSKIVQKRLDDIETAVCCFSNLFSQTFRTSCSRLVFDESNYAKSNWLIFTRLMLQNARIMTYLISQRNSSEPIFIAGNQFGFVDRAGKGVKGLPALASTHIDVLYQPVTEVFRLLCSWVPEFIDYAPPPMVCIIIGPGALILRFARHFREDQAGDGDMSQPSMQEDLLVQILTHFAHYWNIGLLLLDFVQAI